MNITNCTALSIDNKEVESLWLDRHYAYSALPEERDVANEFAYSVLSSMDLSGTATYNGKTFNVYNTFDNPGFIALGTGRAHPIPISPHIVAAAKHYLDYPSSITLSCGTVTVSAWVNLKDWALQNGWTQNDFYLKGSDLADIHLGLLNSTSEIDDGCLPYFASEDFVKRHFKNNTISATILWQASQNYTQAIPYTFDVIDTTNIWTWYTAYYKRSLFNADLSGVLDQMGPQFPIYNEDSCKPLYMMYDGKPIVVAHAHYANKSTAVQGPNYIYAYPMLKAFVEAHGDTLKTAW